jgi:hypothetical protein
MNVNRLLRQYDLIARSQLVVILAAAVLVAAGLASGSDFELMMVTSRYLLIVYAGILAFATPWLMFPQIPMYLYQALNPDRPTLLRILERRMLRLYLPAMVTGISVAIVLMLQGGSIVASMRLALDNLVMVAGLSLYASYRYLRVGPVSQLWQEGKKGAKLLAALKESGQSTGVPPGSLPTIGTTVTVALAGMLAVVFGAWLQGVTGLPLNAAGGVVLLVIGLKGWLSSRRSVDSTFYHAHGFYSELFRNPGGTADGGREPLPMASLYWIPVWFRTLAWTILRQMDRKVPVGRLMITGFVLYWSMLYGGISDPVVVIGIPVLIILLKNLMLLRASGPAFTPMMFRRMLAPQWHWFAARFFVNLRWSLPMYGLIFITVWMSETASGLSLQWLAATDLLLASLIAAASTIREPRPLASA